MGKRFADIFDSIALEFAGADPARIREIAVLKFELEKAQAAGACTLEDVVRVHNLITRRERELRRGPPAPADRGPSLDEIVARYATKPEAAP